MVTCNVVVGLVLRRSSDGLRVVVGLVLRKSGGNGVLFSVPQPSFPLALPTPHNLLFSYAGLIGMDIP